jgi:uncharacterized membrane protein
MKKETIIIFSLLILIIGAISFYLYQLSIRPKDNVPTYHVPASDANYNINSFL